MLIRFKFAYDEEVGMFDIVFTWTNLAHFLDISLKQRLEMSHVWE